MGAINVGAGAELVVRPECMVLDGSDFQAVHMGDGDASHLADALGATVAKN